MMNTRRLLRTDSTAKIRTRLVVARLSNTDMLDRDPTLHQGGYRIPTRGGEYERSETPQAHERECVLHAASLSYRTAAAT